MKAAAAPSPAPRAPATLAPARDVPASAVAAQAPAAQARAAPAPAPAAPTAPVAPAVVAPPAGAAAVSSKAALLPPEWSPAGAASDGPKRPVAAAEKAPGVRGQLRGLLEGLRGKARASSAPRPSGSAPPTHLREAPQVGQACGCMPGGGRAPGLFLKRWRGGGDEARGLREFFAVMLGEGGFEPFALPPAWHAAAPGGAAGGGENGEMEASRSLCLEELSVEGARKLCSQKSWEKSSGLAHVLRPYLEDLITRRQGLRGVVDLLAAAAEHDGSLPRVLTELTAKDLFIALLFAAPRRHRARLAAAYAALRAPLPVVFRGAAYPGGEARTLVCLELLHELACVPQAGRRFIVSIGTQKAQGAGKTFLLGALALTPASEDDLDILPAGHTHAGSCDLLCADPELWVLDMHGCWQSADDESRAAVVALAAAGGASCLVHCTLADFNQKTGVVQKELASLLSMLANTVVTCGTSAAKARCLGTILAVRDVPQDTWASRRGPIEASVGPLGVLSTIPIEDCRAFRSAARRTAAVERYRTQLEAALKQADPSIARPASSLEDFRRAHQLLLGSPAQSTSLALGGGALPSMLALGVGAEFVALLDKAKAKGTVASTLFPLSELHRRLTALRRAEQGNATAESAAASGGEGVGASLPHGTKMEQLRVEENQARARAAEIEKLERQLKQAVCSDALLFFRRCIATAAVDDRAALATELALRLEAWKEPLVVPLLEHQRVLLDAAGRCPGEKRSSDAQSAPAKAEAADVAARLAELDFSMDSFWAELELLVQRAGPQAAGDFRRERVFWQSMMNDGHPFQVLQGRPLQMSGGFLRSVLQEIGAPTKETDPRGIFIVSVIGAQSSAKSTLLNFLFGCGFAVRSGRCTRGLYASYFRPGGGRQPMLVLDSEGLLSLGGEGGTFDGQIALICMTCSHLVIVNHKGELSRQLQDLLEVTLFAMRHLRLARLQPRLVFVLRDQHDRSRDVHEDMLKQMRNHLEDTARTLGTPLQDLILLDGTAVFLLPSAVTSELRQGKEVCWTSELFAREVLQLRGEVFKWLQDDAARRAADGGVPEFISLEHWYDHAAVAWDTLVQFGDQLLHYKTINEIEVRRELADVAKFVVRDALDGAPNAEDGSSGAAFGFHARARQIVDSFVSRIHASPTRLDLETTDLEFCRALACLRDECVARLEELFAERSADPRFGATAKEGAKQQLRTPIEWAYENHLYTWKLHLKKASDERAMHELWVHFTGVLNRHLAGSQHRSCLSEQESRELFGEEWRAYEDSYLARMRTLTKDWQTLAHEVTLLFNHAVGKLQHDAGALALLKEIGPQQVALAPARRKEMGILTLAEQTDGAWEELYFHVGWWASMKARGLALLQTGADVADPAGMPIGLRGVVIPRMRQAVEQGLQQCKAEVRNRGALDEATAAEGLRHITGSVLQDMESQLMAECSTRQGAATLRRPHMLHALQVALRLVCVEALVAIEDDKQEKTMTDLHAQKAVVEEHFLLIVSANKGDVERATNFAMLYHRSLLHWLDHEVMQLAAEVRSQVLVEMPDPRKSSERAFNRSFTERSWPDVLEYAMDQNAYLEKLFLTVFHQKKRGYVEKARIQVEKRINAVYHLLQDVVMRWARRVVSGKEDDGGEKGAAASIMASGGAVKDVVRGPRGSAGSSRSVKELKDFIVAHAERVPKSADTAESHRQLAERLPATADFQVTDPALFAEALSTCIGDVLAGSELQNRCQERLAEALQEQSLQAWTLVKGCPERCPLCGSKCDCIGEHSRHHCEHHLFPAFHGWMDRTTGLPSFNLCLSQATREGTYECRDGTWRKLDEYLREERPNWLPFHSDAAAGNKDLPHLRSAWVNCREALLEYYKPMADHCPQEWIDAYQGEGRPLTKDDLQAARSTIRKLRAHTWMPPDD